MKFIILGPPRTKKNHSRLVRAGRKLRLVPSAAHEVWARSAVRQLRQQRREPCYDSPVSVAAVFFRDRNVGDLVNYLQALADALEHSGIVTNDRLIVSWDGSRLAKDAECPRTELIVAPFEAATNNLAR